MSDKKTISVYDSQVDSYFELINKLPEDNVLLEFINRLKPNSYVLDLGCGPAISSATMCENGMRVDAVDASTEMIKLANQNFDIGARVASFEDINSINTYDAIWANFSLLHATHEDFPIILKSLHLSLKQHGLFHLGMKIGDGSKRDKLERLYSYYSADELKSHLEKTGFFIELTTHGEDLGLAGDIEPWIAITSSVYRNKKT